MGVEALGFEGPDIDAEIIAMCADLWRELGISQYLTLEINSLGNREERAAHRAALVGYLKQHEAALDEDSRRRMHTNPLRVLDSKNPDLQEICNAAPRLADYLGEASRAHYAGFKALLDGLGIAYVENRRLVRGLDYYNQTVFEWTTDKLGAQATVCGGGRYDGLIEELGGKPAPSIGFAMGVERLLLLVHAYGNLQADAAPDIYVIHQGGDTLLPSMQYAAAARAAGFSVLQHSGSQKLAAQMKKADVSGAKVALIVGEGELAEGKASLKDMQQGRGQVSVPAADLLQQLNEWIR